MPVMPSRDRRGYHPVRKALERPRVTLNARRKGQQVFARQDCQRVIDGLYANPD